MTDLTPIAVTQQAAKHAARARDAGKPDVRAFHAMSRDMLEGLLDRNTKAEALLRDFAGLSPEHPPGGVEKAAWAMAIDTARGYLGLPAPGAVRA